MIAEQSIRIACDSCGKERVLTHDEPVEITDHRGVVRDTMNFQYGRIIAEAVNVMVTSGWVLTTARNADGKYTTHASAGELPRSVHRARHFLVCAECSPLWVPPFSQAAARELQRIRLATPESDEVAELRVENERLRAALENVRSTAAAVAS